MKVAKSIVSIFLDFALADRIETRVNEIMKLRGEVKIILSAQFRRTKAQRYLIYCGTFFRGRGAAQRGDNLFLEGHITSQVLYT